MKDRTVFPVCSKDDIAPEVLIDLVSCNCSGDCSKGWCTCKKNTVACTDFCGCGEECQNTDAPPPEGALNVDNTSDEQFGENDECTKAEMEELEKFLQAVDEDLEMQE